MPGPTRRQKIFSVLVFIGTLAASFGILLLPIDTTRLSPLGYAGIFLITLLGAMTLFVPGPTMVAAFILGTRFNPWLISLFAGAGSAIGESTGYITGYSSRAFIPGPGEKDTWYTRIFRWMAEHPFLTLFVFSAIPNPFTDVSGLIAGRIQYSYAKFLLATFFGKVIRFGIGAFLGATVGEFWLK